MNANQTRALAADGATWVRYEYDAANRLKEVIRDSDGALLQRFGHGSSNARFQSQDGQTGVWTLYANVGATTLAEYTEYTLAVPTWTKSYTYLGDSQLATITPNGSAEAVEFNHPDRLGARLKTNQQAGTVSEQAHLPFGTALNAESSLQNNNKRFTSYDRSAITGLDYAVNRTYDSKLGRFTQVDPIDMEAVDAMDPQSLNLFTYCGNDPVNHLDPDGLFFGKLFKAIGSFFKRLFSNKWFLLAVTVALTVIGFGAAAGWWSLQAIVPKTFLIPGYFGGGLAITLPVKVTTALGWVTAGLAAAAAVPALTSIEGLLKTVANFALGNILSHISVPDGPGGTPNWDPDSGGNGFQTRNVRRGRGSRRTGPGSWHYGWRPVRIAPRYVGYSSRYPRDYQTKATVQNNAYFRTEGAARVEAFRKMGPMPVQVQPGKWRSFNGRWQYRAKPSDVGQNHIHLERLDPATGRVLENWHFRFPASGARR